MMKLIYHGRLPGLNEIVGAARYNRFAGASQKRNVQQELEWAWGRERGKLFKSKVNIRVKFYEPNAKRDEDNVMAGLKFILDALQGLGIIKRDSQKWVHVLPEVFVDADDPRVEVMIDESGDC